MTRLSPLLVYLVSICATLSHAEDEYFTVGDLSQYTTNGVRLSQVPPHNLILQNT